MTTGELQGAQPPEIDQEQQQEAKRHQRQGLMLWLLLGFLSLCLLFACGQLANLSFLPERHA